MLRHWMHSMHTMSEYAMFPVFVYLDIGVVFIAKHVLVWEIL